MNVSLWGIRNPAGAVIIFVVLCVAGIYGLRQLPDFDAAGFHRAADHGDG